MGDKQKGEAGANAIALIGAGAWGTTLASIQASNFRHVRLYTLEADVCEEINRFHTNSKYLDDDPVAPNVLATCDIERALDGATTAIVAVPSDAIREVAGRILRLAGRTTRFVLATKGLESPSGLLGIEIWREEATLAARGSVGTAQAQRRRRDPLVLSGPNLAREISRGMPAVSTLAGTDPNEVKAVARRLSHPLLRLVPWHDPVGAQVAGALKNVYAVACGMAAERRWGDNATATIVWRGLAESGAFARAVGGDPSVIGTPAGVGDFVATCTSPLSRNHDLGRMIAGGRPGDENVRGVREGARTAGEALRRSRSLGLDLPLLSAVWSAMSGELKPEAVLEAASGTPRPAAAPLSGAKSPQWTGSSVPEVAVE